MHADLSNVLMRTTHTPLSSPTFDTVALVRGSWSVLGTAEVTNACQNVTTCMG